MSYDDLTCGSSQPRHIPVTPLTPDEITEAEAHMVGMASAKSGKVPLFPVPADAPVCNFALPDIGKPSALYPYRNAEGQLLGYIARFETANAVTGEWQKKVLPVCYCQLPGGKCGWRSIGLPKPRPLYNLPEIYSRPSAVILVGEGEKVAEAGKLLFPDYVSTTPMHGALSPHHTDWEPVAGRTIIITTDCDQAGVGFGDAVFDLCSAAGATRILHLPAEILGRYSLVEGKPTPRSEPVPTGYDIADLLDEGWTARDIAILDQSLLLRPYIKRAELEALQQGLSPGFRLTPQGVEYAKEVTDKNGNRIVEWHWFCSYLAITHQTRDAQGHNWGRILELIDNDGVRKEYIMPMAMLAGDGVQYREELLSRGLKLAPRANHQLHSYITVANPKPRAMCVLKPGWHGGNFILPQRVYGPIGQERIVLQQHVPQVILNQRGTLEEWQQHVGRLCAGNSRLMLAISTALCGPLLHLLEEENFGLHFAGGSSVGKTTALIVAGSVYGVLLGSWRTTDNAAESLARQANDTVLLLDELSQVDAYSADAMTYMLGNGTTKARANRNGSARPAERFRLAFLSSGETGLAAKMMEGGKAAKAGQSVRFIEIPADAGKGYGLFDTIGDFPDSNRLAIALKTHSHTYTGMVGDAYLKALTANPKAVIDRVIAARKEWAADFIPPDSDGQVLRVGQKFALVAAAGELGIALNLLPWAPESAAHACAHIFREWIATRGGTTAYELTEAKRRLRLLIEQHGSARFETAWGCRNNDNTPAVQDTRVFNRAGFKRLNDHGEWEYFILPIIFEQEIISGLPKQAVKAYLAEQGLLQKDKAGKFSMTVNVPGHKQMRLYHVPADVLNERDADGNS